MCVWWCGAVGECGGNGCVLVSVWWCGEVGECGGGGCGVVGYIVKDSWCVVVLVCIWSWSRGDAVAEGVER